MFLNLFDKHPQLSVYPIDINLLYAYYPQFVHDNYSDKDRLRRLDTIICKELEKCIEDKKLTNLLDVQKFNKIFLNSLMQISLTDISEVINALVNSYNEVNNVNKLTVLKETSIEIYAHDLLDYFPESKFIHLIRDPRDNYAALKAGVSSYYSKLGEDEKITISSLLFRAHLGMKLAEINSNKFGNDRYIVVRYEDVINSPDQQMKIISEFLNIEFNPIMLTPTILGTPRKGNSFDGKNVFEISTRNIGRWVDRICIDEVKLIEFWFSDIMDKYGYNRLYNTNDCLESVSKFYKWHNYKYFYNDRFKIME